MHSTFWARTDSGNANNPALNLTGAAATEITFVPSGASGDLILETDGGGIDPDTQVKIDGVTYDFVFELSSTLPILNKNGAQQVPDQFEGDVTYIITVQDYPSAGEDTRLAFLPEQDATQAEMDSFGNGAVALQSVDTTPDPGPVCFAYGTRILTPSGNIAVENLSVGDLVMTLDHGPKPIQWISNSEFFWPGSDKKHLPIQISQNSFGPGKPSRDLVVSPQHKLLISNLNFGSDCHDAGVLAPAKALTQLQGIRVMKGKRRISYCHILLENHEIVISEGLETESFFPGKTAIEMLLPKQRESIFAIYPKLIDDPRNGYGNQIRHCLTYAEAKSLVSISARTSKNTQAHLPNYACKKAA